jgi:hypothetical protein
MGRFMSLEFEPLWPDERFSAVRRRVGLGRASGDRLAERVLTPDLTGENLA